MMSFYRKLELYSRIYWLNYYDTAILDQPFMVKVKPDLGNRKLNLYPYFDLKDIKLILACQSKRRLDYLFRAVLIDILAKDKSLVLDGKLLGGLVKQLNPLEINSILTYPNRRTLNIKFILNEEANVSELIKQLQLCYFSDSNDVIIKRINELTKASINSTIFELIKPTKIDKVVASCIQKFMPITLKIAKFNILEK